MLDSPESAAAIRQQGVDSPLPVREHIFLVLALRRHADRIVRAAHVKVLGLLLLLMLDPPGELRESWRGIRLCVGRPDHPLAVVGIVLIHFFVCLAHVAPEENHMAAPGRTRIRLVHKISLPPCLTLQTHPCSKILVASAPHRMHGMLA